MSVLQSRGRFRGNEEASSILGYAASTIPQCSLFNLSAIIPMIISSVLIDAAIPFDFEKLIQSQPSPNHLKSLITTNAIETMMLTQESYAKNPNIYISCDKGNKKGNKNLAKVQCWYDEELKEIRTFVIDVDQSEDNTQDVCEGLVH